MDEDRPKELEELQSQLIEARTKLEEKSQELADARRVGAMLKKKSEQNDGVPASWRMNSVQAS